MKKRLFHFLAISVMFQFPVSHLLAQITITQADMPVSAKVFNMAIDTSGSLAPQAASSTAQTWNYSTLKNIEMYSFSFVNPDWTRYYSTFHSSTLADSLLFAPGYTYYSLTPAAYSETGFVTTLYSYTAGVNLHPYFTQLPLPATYGTIDGGLSKGDTAAAISILAYDSARIKTYITYSDSVDAFGVMTTPYGTDSVIRQKHYDDALDSVFVQTTVGHTWSWYTNRESKNYQYRWYAKGINYYFALMQMNAKNTKDSLIQWYNGTTVGMNEISHSSVTKVYPNPCKTEVTFNCSSAEAKYISVFDITGRQLSTNEMKNGLLNLNTTGFSPAMYFYLITNTTGTIIDRGKFTVQ